MKNIEMQGNRFVIQKHTIIMYALYILSCIHSATLMAFLTIVPIWMIYRHGKEGAVEYFVFLQFRSLLSTGVAVPISGTAGLAKWAIIFIISLYLLIGYTRMEKREIYNIITWVYIFAIASIIFAWFTSSYPTTASFKVLSYCIPFAAIIKGVSDTDSVDWIRKINVLLGILIFGSVLLLTNSIGYLRNGRSFQGAFNHPNNYAIMIAIFIAGYLYQEKKISVKTIIVISFAVFLLYQTKSRTGMISVLLIVVLFLFTQEMKTESKTLLITGVILLFGFLLTSSGSLVSAIEDYLYKGNNSNILYSRLGQIANNTARFRHSPVIGTGFNVPWHDGVREYAFSFDLITENGNLFMAILGDVGVIGTLVFFILYIKIYLIGKGDIPTIYFVPFLVCMGEMAFFSTNNFAIVLYLFFAIYVSDGYKRKYEVSYES